MNLWMCIYFYNSVHPFTEVTKLIIQNIENDENDAQENIDKEEEVKQKTSDATSVSAS